MVLTKQLYVRSLAMVHTKPRYASNIPQNDVGHSVSLDLAQLFPVHQSQLPSSPRPSGTNLESADPSCLRTDPVLVTRRTPVSDAYLNQP